MFDRAYWQRLINWELLIEEGMISPEDLALFTYVDSVEEAWEIIRTQPLTA
jgi:predicted Rossmann-fold nucleotide-binding protein